MVRTKKKEQHACLETFFLYIPGAFFINAKTQCHFIEYFFVIDKRKYYLRQFSSYINICVYIHTLSF